MDFGLILSQLRIQRQLSQKELAAEMNISSGTIGMWETHKRRPSLYMLVKIAQYFDITTDYLLGISSDPKNDESNSLSKEEQQLIDIYRNLNSECKQVVLGKAIDLKLLSPQSNLSQKIYITFIKENHRYLSTAVKQMEGAKN